MLICPPVFRFASPVLCCLMLGARVAGAGDYLVQTWDTSSSLPHNTVRVIAQTADGYLWLGTENGLARFDGVRFENYVRENSPALANPNIEFLQLDSGGTLWVGALGQIASWDGRRLVAQEWPLVSGDLVNRLLVSHTNEMIFSTVQGCLIRGRLSPGGQWQWTSSRPAGPSIFTVDATGEIWRLTVGGRLWRMSGAQPALIQIPSAAGPIVHMAADASGRLWLGTERQLLRQTASGFEAVAPPPGVGEFSVLEMFPTRDGALWVAANERLWKWQNDDWQLDAGPWPIRQPTLRWLLEDRAGNLWFTQYGSGLLRVNPAGEMLTLTTRNGLPGDRVRSLFEDREGNLWVGLDRGGLVRLRLKQFEVLGPGEGLSDPVALSVCEDRDGVIWAGTYGGGVNRWADGKFANFNFGPEGTKDYVFTVFPDREGRLWVGTRDNGVFVREGGEFRQPFPTNAISAPTRAIFQDRAGTIWLGAGAGAGAFRWRAGQLEHFAADTELARADVRGFAEDREGAMWIGTQGRGLHRFKDGQHLALHTTNGLPNEFVRSLFVDAEGILWIGLYGGGLFRWKNEQLSRAAPSKDLPDDVICNFQEDDQGRLWISTHHGLFRVAKADLHAFADGQQKHVPCIVYGKADGLPALEFSGGVQPAGWRARDGRLWFTTDKGLISLQPAAMTVNPLPPPVALESLLVDSELFASSSDKGPAVLDLNQPLRVPAGRTQFEFRFTGLSYTAPDKVRFQYRLDGLEKDWVDAGINRSVAYNYLPPGEYRFHVRAANNDGVWNENGAAVAFEVLPHFWQRGWFRGLVALVIIGLVWFAYYVRMARLRELERLRLRIARDLHDDVGANLASMALIAEAMEKQPAFGDPGDLRRIALHTIDSLRDIVWFIDPARDRLGDLVSRMRDTVPLLLPGIKHDFAVIVPNPDLNLPPAFRRNVFPIFKEALHNAAVHARAGRVDIRLDCRDGILRLQVQDDGCGFVEKEIIPGNGLRNLRRRAAEMNGAVRIQTAPGHGTTVEFEAPFPQTRGFGFGARRLYSQQVARPDHHTGHESRDAKL